MRRQRRKRHGERGRAVVKRGALEGSGWRWLGPQWMQLAGGEGALAAKFRHPSVAPYLRALERVEGSPPAG